MKYIVLGSTTHQLPGVAKSFETKTFDNETEAESYAREIHGQNCTLYPPESDQLWDTEVQVIRAIPEWIMGATGYISPFRAIVVVPDEQEMIVPDLLMLQSLTQKIAGTKERLDNIRADRRALKAERREKREELAKMQDEVAVIHSRIVYKRSTHSL